MEWSSINWGSLADWFAAVGTVGALILTVFIVLRDRKERHQESADRVLARIGSVGDGSGWDITFSVFNSGTMPVTSVVLLGPDLGIREEEPEEYPNGWHFEEIAPSLNDSLPFVFDPSKVAPDARFPGLHAGESRYIHIRQSVRPDLNDFYYAFFDGRGKMWVRNARTGRYLTGRKARNLVSVAQQESG